jgi:DNA-binding PadR family transcriptional regulator
MPRKSKPGRPPAGESRASRNGLREAILGLLAIRPMSGYDVSRSYRRALQQIWYAPLGQVYPTLRRMRADELLSVSVEVQHDKPNRKVYHLTEKGRRLLVQWLSRPSALPNMHHEFIHKLFLLNHVEPEWQIELVRSYLERSNAWIAELTEIERRLAMAIDGPHGESAWYQLMSLRHLIRLVRTEARSAKVTLGELITRNSRSRTAKKRTARKSQARRGNAMAFGGLSLSPKNGSEFIGDDELKLIDERP